MKIQESTYELLEPIISSIEKEITIDSVVNNGGGYYTLNVCDTLWATVGYNVSIQGNSYEITSVAVDSSIIVQGSVLPTVGTFDLYEPVFYHGTIKVVEQELNQKSSSTLLSTSKMPIIWLHEPIKEQINLNLESQLDRTSDCELFFLIDADFTKWTQDDHFDNAIKQMRKLINAFLEALKKATNVYYDSIESIESTDLPRFGRYTGYSGAKDAIFAQYEMSGTKLNIKIPFLKKDETCC